MAGEIFILGEEEIVTGFRLVGVPGIPVFSREDAEAGWNTVIGNAEVRVLILTEEVSGMLEDLVIPWQLSGNYPLIVELPGIHGHLAGKKSLVESIREAIGLSV